MEKNSIILSFENEESLFLEDEKPINVLDYISRRLVVTSSFYGSCNFQSSQTQKNNHLNYNQISKNENSFLK